MASEEDVPINLISTQPSRFTVIEPERLQRMALLEDIDSEKIIQDRMQRFKQIWIEHDPPAGANYDVENLEFDPIRIATEANTFHEVLLRNRVNQAIRGVTLAFGTGTDLDAIASRYPGGVPRLEEESDTEYRRRVWLSPNILTPHGVAESYIFWAMTSDASYRDAGALTKAASGHIYIPVLMNSKDTTPWEKVVGVDQNIWIRKLTQEPTPSAPRRLATYKYINDPGRKGLTDVIHVIPPKVKHTTYDIDVYTYPGADFLTVMADIRAALDKHIESRRWLGNDHTRLDISAAIKSEGVYNAIINSPAADVTVGFDGFVQVDKMTVRWKGTGE